MVVEQEMDPSSSVIERIRELETFVELGMRSAREVGDHFDYDRTLEATARVPLGLIADWSGIVLFGDDGVPQLSQLRHLDTEMQTLLDLHGESFRPELLGSIAPFLREARLCCQPVGFPLSFARREELGRFEVGAEGAALCLPLQQKHDVRAVLILGRASRIAFTAQELLMAEEFARRMGNALWQASVYQRFANVERELVDAKRRAEIANQAKNHFFAMISHEIRTPLTAILGFSDLLISENSPREEQLDWACRIRQNGQHLLRLIDDMLTLTRGEAGKFQYELSEVSLGDFLAGLEATFQGAIRAKGLSFAVSCEPDVPEAIVTDVTRLNQIFSNLIGNATKFTDHGGIEVCFKYQPQHRFLIAEVSDTGQGLTPQQASKLFTPFSQAEAAHSSRLGGTGLGLALIRQLARGLGGDVEILRSSPGVGSTFQVSLPLQAPVELSCARPPAARAGEASPAPVLHRQSLAGGPRVAEQPLLGHRLLLVDDSRDNQALMLRYLKKAGAEVLTADNGLEAIDKALALRPELVLMDIQMPEMNGYDATRILRVRGFEKPIIALTAHSTERSIEECIEAGCDTYLMKPVSRDVLIEGVLAWIGPLATTASAGQPVRRAESEETGGRSGRR